MIVARQVKSWLKTAHVLSLQSRAVSLAADIETRREPVTRHLARKHLSSWVVVTIGTRLRQDPDTGETVTQRSPGRGTPRASPL
jgi:hypothetical protein